MRISDGDVFSSSVRGNVRKQNEDSCGVFDVPNGKLYIVCDGMGGHAGGATASKLGVDSIANYFQQAKYPDVKLALADALEYANLQIIEAANEMPSLKGMGTTACVLLIQEDEAWIAHCGDSRIYLYCAEQQWLHRITKDQSYVQGLVDQGLITDAEAETHPNKNRILKALGIKAGCKPTVCEQPILPANGDTFLICSDGLSGMVNDEQLQYVLQQEGTILNKGQMMIQLALQAGGLDNITTQLIKISDSTHAHSVFISQNPKERLVTSPIHDPQQSGNKKRPMKKNGLSKKRIYSIITIVIAILVVCGAFWIVLPKISNNPSPKPETSNISVNIENDYVPSGNINKKETPTVTDNTITQIDGNYVIEYWEVYPTVGKHITKSGMYEDDIKVDKFCTDKKKNYQYKQTKGGREINAGVKQNVEFLYVKTIDGIKQTPTINQPEKTTTPCKKRIKVEKYKCDCEGHIKDKLEDVEDIQWSYTYYEDNVQKEKSDYYESKARIIALARERIGKAPNTVLCKVVWYNHSEDIKGSEDNQSKYDAYMKEQKEIEEQKVKKTEQTTIETSNEELPAEPVTEVTEKKTTPKIQSDKNNSLKKKSNKSNKSK